MSKSGWVRSIGPLLVLLIAVLLAIIFIASKKPPEQKEVVTKDFLVEALDHLFDMLGGPRKVLCGGDVEFALVRMETLGVKLSDLVGGLAGGEGRGDDLVFSLLHHFLAHVPDIRNVLHLDY